MKFVIENAKIFQTKNSKDVIASIVIENDKIIDIIYKKSIKSDLKKININGLYLIPGAIDCHTHFRLKIDKNRYNSDDFVSGTKASLSGGITTIIDFTEGDEKDADMDLFKRLKDSVGRSFCDFKFHAVIKNLQDNDDLNLRFRKIKKAGLNSIKIFTTYKERGLCLDEENIMKVLYYASKNDITVCVHAEDNSVISYDMKRYLSNSRKIKLHQFIRSEFSENYAVYKLLKLNERFRAKIYFVHISSYKSLEIIKEYQAKGYNVYAEICPQYFVFDDSIYNRNDSFLYTFTPPVRSKENRINILKNLKYFDTVSTDSCAFSFKDKYDFKDDITKIPMGIFSSYLMISLLYSFGVKEKRLGFSDFIRLISTNASNIFSIKGKGEIKKGNFADFFVFDPSESFIVKDAGFHNSDYSVYKGFKLWGKVKMSFLRGMLVFDNKNIIQILKSKSCIF